MPSPKFTILELATKMWHALEGHLDGELALLGIPFECQKPIPRVYKRRKLECGYRLDFLAAGRVVVEIKTIEALASIDESVMLIYLRLSRSPSAC